MLVQEILRVKGGTLYTVRSATRLQEAIDAMAQADIGSLLVFEQGHLQGLLTFREVMAALSKGVLVADVSVGEVMLREPPTVTTTTTLDEVRRLMLERHSRYVPVMENDMLVGVISFFDVARAVVEEQDRENKQLRAYIHDVRDMATV